MERKRLVLNNLLIFFLYLILVGCDTPDFSEDTGTAMLSIKMPVSEAYLTKVDELINDVTVMVFDDEGDLHGSIMIGSHNEDDFVLLDRNRTYRLFAWANMGTDIYVERIEEIEELTHYLSSPYEYNDGIPMSASIPDLKITKDTCITIMLTRTMAKIGLRIDRSHLDSDTEICIKKVSAGNCPKKLKPFKDNKAQCEDDCFDDGLYSIDAELLNSSDSTGLSEAVYLYIPENLHGCFSPEGLDSEQEKTFDEDDPRKETCSYIEIEAEYQSDSLYCTDNPLIYRFYLGDGMNSLDVERNCKYMIIVTPEGDGISDDCWRVEKTGLHSYVQTITLSETIVDMSYEGEEIQLDAEMQPTHAFIKDVRWSCSDYDVVMVSEEGLVTAVGEGECVITCCSTDGGNAMATCLIRSEFLPPYFKTFPPEGYLEGNVGDSLRISCEVFPPNTPFDIGLEYLESDKNDGRYDYEIDKDGLGVTLKLKKPGSGMIYMEAGEPVNQAALFFIVVNKFPDDSLQVESCE